MKRFLFFTLLFAFFSHVSAQPFTPGNLVVVRFGDGSAILNSNATKTFLDEYTPAGVLVRSIAMPTSVSGSNKRLTNSGTATSEGALSLSADGRYLFLAGYNAAVGTATPHLAAASTINRVVGRVDVSGNINTATVISDGYTGDGATLGNIKAAVSDNGTNIWTSGSSVTGGDGAIRYTTLGNTGSTTQISVSSYTANTRWLGIANDQLYVSNSAFVNRVGTGLPTTGGQPLLPPSAGGSANIYGFLLFDTDPDIPGTDLLYAVAQSPTFGYIGKWLLDTSFGGVWRQKGKISTNAQLEGIIGFRNCAGGVDIYVTRAVNATEGASEIRFFRDSSPPNANISNDGGDFIAPGVSTLIVTAPSMPNPVSFRGISIVPLNGYNVTGPVSIPAGTYNTITVRSGGTATLTGNITIADRITVEAGGILVTGNNVILGFNSGANGGTFILRPGGTLKIGSPQGISISGAIGNIQTCVRQYSISANYEYNGTVPQVTGTGLPTTIAGTLRINNSSPLSSLGVTLTNSTTINGFLDLDLGKLRTSATSLLSISASGNFVNYGPGSFIGGPLQVTGHPGFTYPIGINAASAPTGTIYAPVTMNHFAGTSNPTDSYTAEYIRGNPQSTIGSVIETGTPQIDHISFVEYWSYFRTDGGSNTPTKQIVLEVNPESICYNLETLLVARFDGSQWKNEGNSNYIPLGSSPPLVWGKLFSIPSVNISGYFTLSTTDPFAANPLPIHLISFDAAKLTNTKSSINWELAAYCSAAAKFEIEKANGSNRSFSEIAVVNGSTTNKLYNYIDNDLKNGINYYRLKMIDEGGKITYSRTVAVMNGVNGLLLTSLIPTVVTNTSALTIASSKRQNLGLVITDMLGRVMLRRNYTVASGNTNIELSLTGLAAGVYQMVGITTDGKTNTIRFIKK